MYAKITEDHLYEHTDHNPTESRAGWQLWTDYTDPEVRLIKCRLFDDDGELYYEAIADDEALEDLFDWAQKDAGVTLLKIKNENGEWEDCIG